MADKKITALTSIGATEIGSDDLLHVVDNPGGTPVNKKMTIASLFQNIPSVIACDAIDTETAAASDLGSNDKFVSRIDLSGGSSQVDFTLDNGVHTGQLKMILMSTTPGSGASAVIDVTTWGSTTSTENQITLNALGEAVLLLWDGSKWFVIANYNATIA